MVKDRGRREGKGGYGEKERKMARERGKDEKKRERARKGGKFDEENEMEKMKEEKRGNIRESGGDRRRLRERGQMR